MTVAFTPPTLCEGRNQQDAISVMVVDDSAVVRGIIKRWLELEGGIAVVASAANGKIAIDEAQKAQPEVIILDIEMPVMDGLTALPELKKAAPKAHIIMASTLTRRNADISLKALQLGAVDYITKPETRAAAATSTEFRREIIQKVKAFAEHAVEKVKIDPKAALLKTSKSIRLKRYKEIPDIRVIGVGASTGGPQALFELFGGFGGKIDVPVVVTQHMPKTFTSILAEHLARNTGLIAKEGEDGDRLKTGVVYIAPGDRHMTVKKQGGVPTIVLDDGPKLNFCRPSVDPMFQSLAELYGSGVVSVMLTGMGQDGLAGAKFVTEKGGICIAQDYDSSVVWGMPGAVANAGICHAVLPLKRMANRLQQLIQGTDNETPGF